MRDFPVRDLRKEDARVVDVIHTNWNGFGSSVMSGHAHFFVNIGPLPTLQIQPACSSIPVKASVVVSEFPSVWIIL